MLTLGIESTAHTLGVSVVRYDGVLEPEFLSNIRDAYTTEEGGMIPAELSDHHVDVARSVLEKALSQAKVSMQDIELISYSRSPGIGHALRVGASLARSLALRYKKPLIGVNHCVAHLEIGRVLAGEDDPVLLYASGANTQIIAREAGAYRIFGETLDIGVGNLLDTVARLMDLGFPGGPKLEKLAAAWDGELLELPYSVKGMDVSFTGVQTKMRQLLNSGKHSHEELAFALQEYVFAMLVEVAERALAHTEKDSLVIGGGVGCNKRLQEMCRIMCEERGVRFYAPANEFLVDNAAMIAVLGVTLWNKGLRYSVDECGIDPYERTDEVKIQV